MGAASASDPPRTWTAGALRTGAGAPGAGVSASGVAAAGLAPAGGAEGFAAAGGAGAVAVGAGLGGKKTGSTYFHPNRMAMMIAPAATARIMVSRSKGSSLRVQAKRASIRFE